MTQSGKTHTFTVFLTGPDLLTDEAMDALHAAGCDDALFGVRDGAQYASFDRLAPTFSDALAGAMHDLTSAIDGLSVVRIEPDELVTMAAIAERTGLSRESVRLLSNGQRGPGGFPAPVAYADHRTRLWHWPDVARWFSANHRAKADVDAEAADLVAALNAAFVLRDHVGQLSRDDDRALVAQALGGNRPDAG